MQMLLCCPSPCDGMRTSGHVLLGEANMQNQLDKLHAEAIA